MAWFKKKPDLISDLERTLDEEIAEVQARIKQIGSRAQQEQTQPRLRPAALPYGEHVPHTPSAARQPTAAEEPIFEEVRQDWLKAREEPGSTPDHYNALGVRKYDLPAFLRRIRSQFRGRSTTNPKLVSYLAAGGFQGLRPLRYEKRVARNRFLVSVAILLLALLGTLWVFVKHH